MLKVLTNHLRQSAALSSEQVAGAVAALLDEATPVAEKADCLAALAATGETVEEVAAFARELRARAIQPPLDARTRSGAILDVCGMGGDRLNTFNISTTVALILAAAGVAVAKHGNRAISSQTGSADVLEALGIPIDLSPEQAAASLRDYNFAFFFAPNYHPAFKFVAPARKLCAERGQRTIFNILGPLLNPAKPSAQLVGVPRPELCEPIGHVLQSLGGRRGMVVCGKVDQAWLDELSIFGENVVAEFYQDRGFAVSRSAFEGFPFQPATLQDLAGGDRETNAQTVRGLLHGKERGPKRDAVLLNAAAALFVADRTRSVMDGWSLGEDLLDSGAAAAKLDQLALSRPS